MPIRKNGDVGKGFRVSARTVLQLGGELISSDGIAFYELLKNAVDAGSPSITIEVVSRIPFDAISRVRHLLELAPRSEDPEQSVIEIIEFLCENVDPEAPDADKFTRLIKADDAIDHIGQILDDANTITFRDTGHGMSLKDLENIYLHIGTPARLLEKRKSATNRVLGEKGLGRLSVMRLGSLLYVKTSCEDETNWNELRIDWRDFDRDLDEMVEDVAVAPKKGGLKTDISESGTTITVTALRSEWTEHKLKQLAMTDLARVMDPFAEQRDFSLELRFNGHHVPIEPMNELLFSHAHAIVTAQCKIRSNGEPLLSGVIDYRLYHRQQPLRLEKNDLSEAAGGVKLHVLEDLGPFELKFFWFNRRILDPIEGLGNVAQVRKLIKQWSGGLMVYRDGFRVPPYGSPEDDWLDLDRKALSYKSYKVNRAQLIGKVDITGRGNPRLIDQTNREGLADCPEKSALVALLQNLVRKQFRSFLDEVDEQISLQRMPTLEDIETRFGEQESKLKVNISRLRKLAQEYPESGLESLAKRFASQAKDIAEIINDVREAQGVVEQRQERLMDLAGLGLMVEILAHELNRSVVHSLKGLATALNVSEDNRLNALLRSAEAQLRSLQKRVSALDRLSIVGRQRKSVFDPIEVVYEVIAGRAEQFERHKIKSSVIKGPIGNTRQIFVRMVKGVFYQIIENLVENSVYWLKTERELNSGFKPQIYVRFDIASSSLYFSDNGPGIDPVNADRVFTPFFSLKRKDRGKGLGLYIAREYARDQGVTLTLSTNSKRDDGRLNTFILDLSGAVKE
jgi:signal transduction histidine kinase